MADLLRFTVPGKPEYVGVVRLAVDLQPRIRQDSMLKISRILRSQFRKSVPMYSASVKIR